MTENAKHVRHPAGGRFRAALRWLLAPLAIDVRALAAFRIGVGLLLLADLANRACYLTDHYTDRGVFPRAARWEFEASDALEGQGHYQWSLHMASGETWAQAALFAAAAVFAVWLAVGYRTRLATVASWMLLASLQARNPLLNDSGDRLLRLMLFWSMFLPLAATASVDRRRAPSAAWPRAVLSVGGAALLLQLCQMYWVTAAAKNDPVWNRDYTAIYYALSVDQLAGSFGHWLLRFPELLRGLTMLTYWLEWLLPTLALLPPLRGWPRVLVVLSAWALHLGIMVAMNLPLLSAVVMVAWIPFLPPVFWDALGRRWKGSPGTAETPTPESTLPVTGSKASTNLLHGREWLVSAAAASLLAYVIAWNVSEATGRLDKKLGLSPTWRIVGRLTHLEQYWQMFAPRPLTGDGWYVMRGKLHDGGVVNLWEPGLPLPYKKPSSVRATYHGLRWGMFLVTLWRGEVPEARPYLAHWLARRWDERYSEGKPEHRVKSVEILFRLEETPPPGEVVGMIKNVVIWTTAYEPRESPAERAERD